MFATRRPTALVLVLLAGCYQKPGTPQGDTDGTSGAVETDTVDPSTTATATTVGSSSSSPTTTATTNVDDTTTTATDTTPGSSDDASGDPTGPVVPTICDQQPTTLAACAGSSKDLLNQGTLDCDPAVMFTAFFEDIYTVDLVAGDCVYVNVDNISDAGPTGAPAADVAFHLRSPSGAYAFADDEVACSDVTWTGGACPEATLSADVAGTWEISVVQASGGGCTAGAPYILYVAINGVATIVAPVVEDQRTDC